MKLFVASFGWELLVVPPQRCRMPKKDNLQQRRKNDPLWQEGQKLFEGPPEDLKDLPHHLQRIEAIFGKYGVRASTVVDGYEVTSDDTMESLLNKQEMVNQGKPVASHPLAFALAENSMPAQK